MKQNTGSASGAAGTRRPMAVILGLLLFANILNFIDRHLPFILIDGIKADLSLSDTEIALMSGVSFALVYSFAALPLAHLADTRQPRWIMAGCLAAWSLATGLSGLAANFWQLLLCRMGVAASEAGSTPAAHAIIARSEEPHRRAFALSVFSLGVPIGSMFSLALGGWISDTFGWRAAFLIVGLPGLALAAVCAALLPRLTRSAAPDAHAPSFARTARWLWSLPSFRLTTLGNLFYAAASYGTNAFAPAFFMRAHALSPTEAGLAMGFVYAVGGIAGTLGGGVLADYLSRRDEGWRLRVPALGQWLSLPLFVAAWMVGDVVASVALLCAAYMLGLLAFAPSFAAVQALVPDTMRATAPAVMLLFMTLVGASVGPLVVGGISDANLGGAAHLSLRPALTSLAISIALAGITFQWAERHYRADLQKQSAITG